VKIKMSNKSLVEILPQQGLLSKTSWNLPESMTEQDWKLAGKSLTMMDGALNWWLGDWWNFGGHQYGERKALVESEEWEGPAYQTCKDIGMVCAGFERSRRRDLVPFNHHRELISLPEPEADKLLDWCENVLEESGRVPTISTIRDRVKQVKAWLAQGWTTEQLERRDRIEQGLSVVANQSKDKDGKLLDAALIAWADQQGLMEKIDRTSDWGNPFELKADGDRATVIENYHTHYLPFKPSLLKKVKLLKGKVLVCWCFPEACHGDHLAELANDTE
jgi:hypothetical protein